MSYYWTTFGTYKPPNAVTVTGLDPSNTSHTILLDVGTNSHVNIDTHISDTSNPHGATLTQTTINSVDINNSDQIVTDSFTSLTGKITTLQCGEITNISPATTLLISTPIDQLDSILIDNLSPTNVVTTSAVGPLNTYTKTPINSFLTASNTVTLTNKTLNSAVNTITVTNLPLIAENINSLLNQDVRSTASPTFVTPTITNRVNVQTTNSSGVLINQALNPLAFANGLLIQSGGVLKLDIGHNQNIDSNYISSVPSLRFLTNGVQRILVDTSGLLNITSGMGVSTHIGANTSYAFVGKGDFAYSFGAATFFTNSVAGDINLRNVDTTKSLNIGIGITTSQISVSNTLTTIRNGISLSGIANNNAATDILALNGTTVVTKNNVIDTTSMQILSNKTLIDPFIQSTSVAPIVNFNTLTLPADRTFVFSSSANNNATFIMSSGSGQTVSQSLTFSAAPNISTIINTGTLTLPTSTDTIVARTTVDTLTNKTLNSSANTITITNAPLIVANINTLINQDVRTTATPSFTGTISLLAAARAMQQYPVRGSIGNAVTVNILTIPVPINSSVGIFLQMSSKCLDGTQTGFTSFLYDWKGINNAGVVTVNNGSNQSRSDTAIAGAYNGKTIVNVLAAGADILVRIVTTLASGTCQYGGTCDVTFS